MSECARLFIAQEPRDRRYGKVPFSQIAFCKIVTQFIENCSKTQSLGCQSAGERSLAHAELARQLVDPRLAMRQKRDDGILHTHSQGHRRCSSLRLNLLAVVDQDLVEVWISTHHGHAAGGPWKCDLVGPAVKCHVAAEK